jgi:GntR family transcriptional regulator, rspAB operon transcriptional repressor
MESTMMPITERKLSSHMYRELENAIVECSLPPGTSLSDRELAQQFGVSRTPVRDTLHLLESSGLVERGKRTGWTVTEIRLQDVQELYELRALLEPAGLGRIVEWEDGALAKVATMFDGFSVPMAQGDVERYLTRDDEFHQMIIKATGNSHLTSAYYVVDRQLARCKRFVSYQDDSRREDSLLEHRRVCEALGRRDEKSAREALLDHIRTAKDALTDAIKATTPLSA